MLSLVEAGYGSLKELKELDTDDFLDVLEYRCISMDIQAHQAQQQQEALK